MAKRQYIFRKKHPQHGAAIMLILLVILVGATTFFAVTQNPIQSEQQKTITDLDNLKRAKQALIAYAAFQNTPAANDSPGELPCPDRNNDGMFFGAADFNPGSGDCRSYVGWLPFITLDIEEIRDSSGNRFWYAVSDNYQTARNAILNSTTPANLTLDGNAVVAVIIAPGEPIDAVQSVRPTVDTANLSDVVVDLYLDFLNADGNPTDPNQTPAQDAASYFSMANNPGSNDVVIGITAAELWQQASKWPLQHARAALRAFDAVPANNYLPFAKDSAGNCAKGGAELLEGLLPVDDGLGGDCTGGEDITVDNWFHNNDWDHVIFYIVASNCAGEDESCGGNGDLELNGAGPNHEALLIDAGTTLQGVDCASGAGSPYNQPLDPTVRAAPPPGPPGSGAEGVICDYLELNENTDSDTTFIKPAANQLSNDQFLTVDL